MSILLSISHGNISAMSHTHTAECQHSPATPQFIKPTQSPVPITPIDPALQAALEADFRQVDLKLGPPDNSTVLCSTHSLEKCVDCNLDFVNMNRLAKLLILNPNILCPPPPNIVSQKLTQAINTMKEEGNVCHLAF